MKRILFALALGFSVAACEAPSDASAKPPEMPQPAGWKAVVD